MEDWEERVMGNDEGTSGGIIGRVRVVLVGVVLRAVRLWERYCCGNLKNKMNTVRRWDKRSEDNC